MQQKSFFAMLAFALALAACGTTQTSSIPATTAPATTSAPGNMPGMGNATPMAGMDHGTMTNTAPYDAQFIDSMLTHHAGAIAMAKQALGQAEHPEIKQLANDIIASQQADLKQMQDWRKQWYPDLAVTGGMGMAMGDMQISSDTSMPFDQRFMAAMIPHHQGATMMARDAQTKAEHTEIKTLATNVISAQDKEIAQMQAWLKTWYAK